MLSLKNIDYNQLKWQNCNKLFINKQLILKYLLKYKEIL